MLNPFFHNHEEIVKDNFECFFKITKEEVDAVVNLRLLQKKLRKKFGDVQYSDEFFDGACSAICHRENAMEYLEAIDMLYRNRYDMMPHIRMYENTAYRHIEDVDGFYEALKTLTSMVY